MEHLEIVHEHTGEPLGIVLPRKDIIEQQAWCRVTDIFVMNADGAILCHQRSSNKERFPNFWLTHLGGHVAVGETYESNALKELEEEAGVKVEPHELIAWRTTQNHEGRFWTRQFVVLVDKPVDHFVPQPGEVAQFAWKMPQDILKEAKETGMWRAGVHDFWVEYHCLRAALATAHAHGLVQYPHRADVWSIPMQTTI